VKDIVPRYQTLRGRRVERRFGWDCHGLPAEMEAEKELRVSGRAAIQKFGIGNFNAHCRESVLRYTDEWHRYVTRSARWVDFGNDYKTMDRDYMESVLWGFKRLWEKGLLYEGKRVVPYSWAAETPLSNFETRLDNSYREREDPAITVRFALRPEGDDRPTDVLAWTTTPWTLPSNLALAVGPEIDYAIFELAGRRLILGAVCVEEYAAELADAERVGTVRGSELVGRHYQPLFSFFEGTENAFRVVAAPFVDVEEGTGVVHLAPGFGEEDMDLCEAEAIPVVCPVDDEGKFTAEVPPYQGMQVIAANRPIIRELRERGLVFKHENHIHNYPHCWRTDTPLIYRAVNSWYVRVTEFRDRMVELNQNINWVPGHIRDGLFGKWLENARDWSISRNRFWGAPIPVWKSDDPEHPRLDVYGSVDEIERDFGVRPDDLHRPAIDELVRPNPDDPSGRSVMRRISDVLDCWFESGSMFYAQVHYPFENREWFESHFPADFIVEYVAQTRGWF
jgi:isoleucyl-tRNA synthetase